ncbi:MAG: hypothetical protein K2W96_16635 [Gemmataceae bacterium]|nr:hypothetical protein [Gemmataceae bacterium]
MTTRRRALGLERLEDRTVPAVLFVSSTDDSGSGSLREAIALANSMSGADTIRFAFEGSNTITLQSALPDITDDLVIQGDGAAILAVERSSSAGDFGIFAVAGSGVDAEFRGLTIRNGRREHGGGVLVSGGATALIADSLVEYNTALGQGIFGGYGGGAAGLNGSRLDVQDSLFRGNYGAFGGAVANENGTLDILRSTLTGNSGQNGGAVFTISGGSTSATTSLRNVTVDGNTAAFGAVTQRGRTASASTFLYHSTISGNSGDGLYADTEDGGTSNLAYANCLFAGNGGTDIANGGSYAGPLGTLSFTSNGYNASDESSGYLGGTGDVAGAGDLKLAGLGNYGGPVPTRALLPGSPALDVGPSSDPTDARGEARPASGANAGAYESQGYTFAFTSGEGQSVQAGSTLQDPLVVRLTETGGNPLPGARVTFTLEAGSFPDGSTTAVVLTDANGDATAPAITASGWPGYWGITAATDGGPSDGTYYTSTNASPTITGITLTGTTAGERGQEIPEGKTLTVSGSFTDPGDDRAHVVYVYWGDDDYGEGEGEGEGESYSSYSQAIYLDAGDFDFEASYAYTSAGGLPDDLPARVTLRVYVEDASGYLDMAQRDLTVTDQTAVVDAGFDDFFNEDEPFTRQGSFSYDGAGEFIVVADYGDGTGLQPVAYDEELRTFTLSHAYDEEGTYVVNVFVDDGTGMPGVASFQADVMLPMVEDADKGFIGPQGGSATVAAEGVTGTLTTNGGRRSAIIVARVPDGVADAQDGNLVVGSGDRIAGAFDVRAIGVGPEARATVVFRYNAVPGVEPRLTFYDRLTRREVVIPRSEYVLDPIARTITITFTSTSFVRLDMLRGTVFTITVPIANQPTTATGFQQREQAIPAAIFLTATAFDAGAGGAAAGPGGGPRSTSSDLESDPGSTTETPEKDEGKLPAGPARAEGATSRLPVAPKATISLPGVTLTPPQPRRFDLGPMPGGEEEQEAALDEEAALWFREEEIADVERRDDAFAELGEAKSPEAAWTLLMPLLAVPAQPRKRRALAG